MTKKYITPMAKEPEFVVVPSGSLDEKGNKLKRVAIAFQRNAQGAGQYITSDLKEQKFLEESEWFKSGKLVALEVKGTDKKEDAPEPTQATGPQTSEVVTKGKGKKAVK